MSATVIEDRLRAFIDLLLEGLDDRAGGEELARRAFFSRFHFDRLFAAGLGEPPGAFRRRLLLERAAYDLGANGTSVAQAAVDAGYASAEAFARAFRRAFGAPPSRFSGAFRLPAPNGVHFHPPGGLLIPAGSERRQAMDLVDRMLEHDLWLTGRLLDGAAQLPDGTLDEPLPVPTDGPNTWFEDGGTTTVRSMLERLIYSKEIWTAAFAGRRAPGRSGASLDELRRRHEQSGAEFAAVVRDIRDRNAWDTAFVDALCDPPETFTFGGMVAHVLTWSAHRRQVIVGALRRLGAQGVGSGDPIEWERRAA